MKKTYLITIAILVSMNLPAQEKYTITGKVYIKEAKGNIFLNLVDEETNKTQMKGVKQLVLSPGKNPIAFKFEGVTKGEYALKCFQDTNGNEKLDMGMFGPKEPWYLSWNGNRRFPPRWQDINFKLDSNKSFEVKLE